MLEIPENILSVLGEENRIREKSLKEVQNNIELQDHVKIIDSGINLIMWISTERKHQNEEEEVLRQRGMRLGNDFTADVNLIFAGYYHVASMLIRSIEESSYLLFYFEEDRVRILEWRDASLQESLRKYPPRILRESFKKRMEEHGSDQAQQDSLDVSYQFYCELGTHPSPEDWRLFRMNDTILLGPFFDPQRLDAYLHELAGKAIIAVSALVLAFGSVILVEPFLSTYKDYQRKTDEWLKKYGDKVNPDDLENIRKILRK